MKSVVLNIYEKGNWVKSDKSYEILSTKLG